MRLNKRQARSQPRISARFHTAKTQSRHFRSVWLLRPNLWVDNFN